MKHKEQSTIQNGEEKRQSMKTIPKIILWFLSVVMGIFALAFFTAGALPGLLMLAGAVLLNPIFIGAVRLKKGLTALLVIALFIASVAVLPEQAETNPAQATEVENEETVSKEQSKEQSALQLIQAGVVQPENNQISTSTARAATVESAVQPTQTPTLEPTSTQKPTPKPTSTTAPTPTPTQRAKAATKARSAGIVVIDYTDVVGRGERASIKIQGEPNTAYTCNVEYKSGLSTAEGLGEKQSDAEGYVSWSWKVGSKTSLDYKPTIMISGGGDSISVSFEVVK